MEFMVSRTSSHSMDAKPCKEAYLKAYTRIDERTVNSPSKIPFYKNQPDDWWYSEGKNHRVEHGHIMRDFDDEGWFIELDTLEDLLKFHKKYGRLVIEHHWNNHSILEIEMYDDWRE